MAEHLGAPWAVLGWTVVNTAIIYAVVIVLVRIQGLRSFAKMSSFDFASTVAVGSIMATTAASPSVSLAAGSTAAATLFAVQLVVALARRSAAFRSAVDNDPLLLMVGSEVLHENLRRGQVTEDDLRGKLREANVLRVSEVRAVILETTGDISVMHGDPDGPPLEDYLMQGVRDWETRRRADGGEAGG